MKTTKNYDMKQHEKMEKINVFRQLFEVQMLLEHQGTNDPYLAQHMRNISETIDAFFAYIIQE